MKKYIRCIIVTTGIVLSSVLLLHAQETYPLWPEEPPYAVGDSEDDVPTLTIFLPEEEAATGSGVVIFPGGGYGHLAMEHEGYDVAERFNEMGLAAFVVKYRHGKQYGHPVPLRDARRAIRMVKHRSKEWNVNPENIGVIGFSAGGHLASTAGTLFEEGNPNDQDPVEQMSSRPEFMVLVYPVISMTDEITHQGSRNNLLGENPNSALVDSLSSEKQVSSNTPPTFLIHTSNDGAVPVENSLVFYQALKKVGVPAEMHIFEEGPHGFGLGEDHPLLSGWMNQLQSWLKHRNIIH
ncbi:alpha/beta hydrolase fold domain-containing protein [Aliifodinibius salicampi]|uniref:Alpha/beta hydrolase fold domain-containing protein n=1 Tax=Fodinibius salicampi TaxID=1920655 RepID=A0ABT3PZK7_9BACT|nr:alpha/beta hydrolase fold domain-containing protein [Fodinibius salicampi]MCW9713290.1 alpha/beta hydrolase fold domain-containing protein [Fodinibius salicampi]